MHKLDSFQMKLYQKLIKYAKTTEGHSVHRVMLKTVQIKIPEISLELSQILHTTCFTEKIQSYFTMLKCAKTVVQLV